MSALRVGAAIWLLCFHLAGGDLLDGLGLPQRLLVALRNGAPMTGFFIMMSGFMMYYAYTRPDGTLSAPSRRIWVGRLARLWPVMMVGHLLAAPFAFVGGDQYGALEAFGRGVAVATALQGWVPAWAYSYNVPAWTLSVLAFCYALLPWIVRRLQDRTPRQLVAMLLACWAAALLPTAVHFLALPTGFTPASDATHSTAELFLQAFPPLRLPEFVMGAVLGRLFLHRDGRQSGRVFLLGVTAGAGVLAFLSAERVLPSRFVANGLLAPLLWCVLLGVACAPATVERWVARTRLTDLGDASLSVFLLHMPFVMGFQALHRAGLLPDDVRGPVLGLFIVAIFVAASMLETRFVQPMAGRLSHHLESWLGPSAPRPRIAAVPREPFSGPITRRQPRPTPHSSAA